MLLQMALHLVFIITRYCFNMKKIIIFILFSTILFLASSCIRRTPESILLLQFGIDFSSFDYSVDLVDDNWISPHGDGHCHIIYSVDSISPKIIDDIINAGGVELPISDSVHRSSRMKKEIRGDNHKGYYIYTENSNNPNCFKYFILDITDKKAFLYYQIM